jgi:hypothetical protein
VFEAEHNDQRTRTLAVQLANDGSARIDGNEIVQGAEAATFREYYQAPGTRGERFERNLAGTYPGLKLESQRFEQLDNLEQPVRFSYRISVPQLARWDGDELKLEPSVLHDLTQEMARLPERIHSLDLQGNRVYKEERNVRVPAGLRLSEIPPGGKASSEFGRLDLSFVASGSTLTAHTEFVLLRDRITPEQYPAFRRWVEAADQVLKQRIGLRKEQTR